MRKVAATPEKMVEKDGTINFGTFKTPFRNARECKSNCVNGFN
jgi:hypothetical protein